MKTRSKTFISGEELPWEPCGPGVRRRIMGYDPHLMVVRVAFDKDAVGATHTHYHSQVTQIESGRYEVTIGGESRVLGPGDGYYVLADEPHGLHCLEPGAWPAIPPPRGAFFLKNRVAGRPRGTCKGAAPGGKRPFFRAERIYSSSRYMCST